MCSRISAHIAVTGGNYEPVALLAKISEAVSETKDYGIRARKVSGNGIGIEPQYHDKIFVAFKRLHGRKIPGAGIRLAICQRVVERYGGRIRVDSQAGKGATFIFKNCPTPPLLK